MMIYVVWTEDDDGEFGWFSVWPTKKQAMEYARSYAGGKTIIYLKHDSGRYSFDYDATAHVIVEQRESIHTGA